MLRGQRFGRKVVDLIASQTPKLSREVGVQGIGASPDPVGNQASTLLYHLLTETDCIVSEILDYSNSQCIR